MADDLVVSDGLTIAGSELSEKFSSSGGPGGQHANRSSTRVELTFDVVQSKSLSDHQRRRIIDRFGAEVRVVADAHRSQTRNRAAARERLAEKLSSSLVTQKRRRDTKPSRGAQKRRLNQKRQRSELKQQRRKPIAD